MTTAELDELLKTLIESSYGKNIGLLWTTPYIKRIELLEKELATYKPPVASEALVHGNLVRCSLNPREWPYGPPDFHEPVCLLFEGRDYCDCKASDVTDTEYGMSS